MDVKRINLILRIIGILLLILLAFLSLHYRFAHCEKCDFDVKCFMAKYKEDCLQIERDPIKYEEINLSISTLVGEENSINEA